LYLKSQQIFLQGLLKRDKVEYDYFCNFIMLWLLKWYVIIIFEWLDMQLN
jgi:hypothetical protein